MNKEPPLILVDIIKTYMLLSAEQVYIYSQNFKLSPTSSLFVAINLVSSKNYSTTNNFIPAEPPDETAQEEIISRYKETYSINIFSRDGSARIRKNEIVNALNSNISKNMQETYQFKIANISNGIQNLSGLEGGSIINRFAINIDLLTWTRQLRTTPYYDKFQNQLINNDN